MVGELAGGEIKWESQRLRDEGTNILSLYSVVFSKTPHLWLNTLAPPGP